MTKRAKKKKPSGEAFRLSISKRKSPKGGGRPRISDGTSTRVTTTVGEADMAAIRGLLEELAEDPYLWGFVLPIAETKPRPPRLADVLRLLLRVGLPNTRKWLDEHVAPVVHEWKTEAVDRELREAAYAATRRDILRRAKTEPWLFAGGTPSLWGVASAPCEEDESTSSWGERKEAVDAKG